MSASTKEDAKEKYEKSIFEKFVDKCPDLSLDKTSIKNRKWPEADILCDTKEGESIAFELVEICDSNIAKSRGDLIRKAKLTGEGDVDYIRTSDPTENILENKLKKNRYAGNVPVELLCYTNGRTASPEKFIKEKAAFFLNKKEFQYRRIWLLTPEGVSLEKS